MELWWEEFRGETDRDQLSFEFAAWKTGLKHRRVDIDVGSSGELFSRHNHRPPGIIGDLWDVVIRAEANRSDFIADIYYLLASALYYLHRTREIYTEQGLFSLYREIKSFSLRKLRWYGVTIIELAFLCSTLFISEGSLDSVLSAFHPSFRYKFCRSWNALRYCVCLSLGIPWLRPPSPRRVTFVGIDVYLVVSVFAGTVGDIFAVECIVLFEWFLRSKAVDIDGERLLLAICQH